MRQNSSLYSLRRIIPFVLNAQCCHGDDNPASNPAHLGPISQYGTLDGPVWVPSNVNEHAGKGEEIHITTPIQLKYSLLSVVCYTLSVIITQFGKYCDQQNTG